MAIFSPGPIAGAISGVVGGLVFKAGQRPAVAARTARRPPRQSPQALAANARLAKALSDWRAMGDDFRAQWANTATQITFNDRLGRQRHLSGKALWIHHSTIAQLEPSGYGYATWSPTSYLVLSSFAITADEFELNLSLTVNPSFSDGNIHTFASRTWKLIPCRPRAWRWLKSAAVTGSMGIDLTTAWTDTFGPQVMGEYSWLRLYFQPAGGPIRTPYDVMIKWVPFAS